MFTLLSFQACSLAQEKDSFSLVINTMPLKYEEDKGGYLIDTKGILRFGQYSQASMFSKKYGKIEGPIASAWYITRSSLNEKEIILKHCGNYPIKPKEYLVYSNIKNKSKNEINEIEFQWKNYHIDSNLHGDCRFKVKKEYIEPSYSNQYYYVKALPNLKITYPKKHERHASWQAIVFKGRVGDLTSEALTSEQKNNLEDLRAHKCYKWSRFLGVPQKACYDLQGKDSSIYYGIRQELFKENKSSAKYSVNTEHLRDIRIYPPVKWTEIKGIKINKEMYDYVYQQCRQGKDYCHFNNYKGSLTKEQKEYIKTVTWKTDKVYEK